MPISQAFKQWEAAHAAYMEAERRLADAQTLFAFGQGEEPRRLREQVAQLQREAERLMQAAMAQLK